MNSPDQNKIYTAVIARPGSLLELGAGFDAISGRVLACAIASVATLPRSTHNADVRELHIVRRADDAVRVLGCGDRTLVLDLPLLDVYPPDAQLLSLLQYSETSFSLVISYRRTHDVLLPRDHEVQLAADAFDVLITNSARFCRTYGRDYVWGHRTVDAFFGVLSFSFPRKEDCDEFAKKVTEVRRSWDLSYPRHDLARALEVLGGYNGQLTGAYLVAAPHDAQTQVAKLPLDAPCAILDRIYHVMNVFVNRIQPPSRPTFALIRPYPTCITGTCDAVQDLTNLRRALISARLLLNALPYADSPRMMQLYSDWRRFAAESAFIRAPDTAPRTFSSACAGIVKDLEALTRRLAEIDAVQTFYVEMKYSFTLGARPRRTKLLSTGVKGEAWLLGFDLRNSMRRVHVSIGTTETITLRPLGFGRFTTVKLGKGYGILVGVRIRPLRGNGICWFDGNGDNLEVVLQRDRKRVCAWEVTTFVVRDCYDLAWLRWMDHYGAAFC